MLCQKVFWVVNGLPWLDKRERGLRLTDSGSGSNYEYLDRGASKELINPLWLRIYRFLWRSTSESTLFTVFPVKSWTPEKIWFLWRSTSESTLFTVFPVKPWTPEKISGMFIVSRPIRCEMKPQKITDKPQQGSLLDMKWAGFFFYKKSSIFPLDLSEKAIFLPQTNISHLIPSVQRNQTTE